nr:hypothetical protein [Paenibacillus aestuarii]
MQLEADVIAHTIAQELGHPPDLICLAIDMHDHSTIHCLYIVSNVMTKQVDELIIKPIIEASQQGSHAGNTEWLKSAIPLGQRRYCMITAKLLNNCSPVTVCSSLLQNHST